jgi:AMP nucleosidase
MNNDINQRTVQTPANSFPTEGFDDAAEAVTRLSAIYEANTSFLRDAFARYRRNERFEHRVRACYPFVRVSTDVNTHVDSRRSYGFVAGPGVFETTVTRPDLFGNYYREQLRLLAKNHHVQIEVGVSDQPIPIHFAFAEGIHLEGDLDRERLFLMRDIFDTPDLALLDDRIVNGTYEPMPGEPHPLALFTAARVDFSLHRLKHYTATAPTHVQNYVLYTNYQFYIDEFVKLGRNMMARTDDEELRAYRSEYTSFVEPGDVITYNENLGEQAQEGTPPPRLPQMPAYHLKQRHHDGEYRRRAVEREDDHRSHRGTASSCVDHARSLRGVAQHAASRRLRACARLCARGSRARRRFAAVGADSGARRGAGCARARGRAGHAARRRRVEARDAHGDRGECRQPQLGTA